MAKYEFRSIPVPLPSRSQESRMSTARSKLDLQLALHLSSSRRSSKMADQGHSTPTSISSTTPAPLLDPQQRPLLEPLQDESQFVFAVRVIRWELLLCHRYFMSFNPLFPRPVIFRELSCQSFARSALKVARRLADGFSSTRGRGTRVKMTGSDLWRKLLARRVA